MSEPNYRQLSPPEDKRPEEYTWAERRGELYDMIERAGHYRNLEQSQRDLGRRYSVSHTTIQKDIAKVLEQWGEQLGEHAKAELDTIKTRAVQDLLDDNKSDKAYYLMMNHYQTLMDAGVKERAPDKTELSGGLDISGEDAYFEMLAEKNDEIEDTDVVEDKSNE